MKNKTLAYLLAFAVSSQLFSADTTIVDEVMQSDSVKIYVDINTYVVNAVCTDPNANLSKEDTFKVCVAAKKFDAKKRIDSEFRKSLTQFFRSNPSKVSEAQKNLKNEDALGALIMSPLMNASVKIGNEWAAVIVYEMKNK